MRIDTGLDDTQTGVFSNLFEEEALSCACKKDKSGWDYLWTWGEAPDAGYVAQKLQQGAIDAGIEAALVKDFTIEELEDRDWLAESYRALPPINVGSFFVYGSHYDGEVPDGKIPLLIEAATAFGSGEHGTTSCCMLAIEHVKDSGFAPRNILDMGCGSGILAAASARLWPELPVFAADNDPECVRVTDLHLQANNITNVTSYVSEGYEAQSAVWKDAPYDFIIANILAAPLIEMAEDQTKALADGGYLILSGTLAEQEERLLAAYTPHGMHHVKTYPKDEWVTLLLRKNPA